MSQVNITLNTNTVDVNTTNNQIVVTDPTNPNVVNITQPVTSVVEVITAGPQGAPGPAGAIPNTGSFATTGSNTFRGNQIVTGSVNITGSLNTNNTLYVSGSRVGIGTATPTALLDVNGTSYLRGVALDGIFGYSGNNIAFSNSGNTTFIGNVGIGISTPTSLLYISGASSANLLRIDSPAVNNILFVSGSGRVGIGTNNPSFNLDVAATTGASQVGITSAANSLGEINFKNTGYPNSRWTVRASGAADGSTGNLSFQRGSSTTPMTILQNENILLGTTSDSGARLTLRGSGATSSTTTLIVQNSTPSTLFSILDNGNVGVGTTSSLAKLQVQATSSNETTQRWTDDAGNLLGDFAELGDAGVLRVGYAISNAVTARPLLTLNGGSGNSSAAVTLRSKTGVSNVVLGSDTTSFISGSNLALGYIPGSAPAVLNISGSISDTLLKIDSPASSSILFVSGSGRVGIGTSAPLAPLDILVSRSASTQIAAFRTTATSGHISLYNFTDPQEIARIESSNDISNGGSLRLYTRNGSNVVGEKMRITGTGEVGIGTTTPTGKLSITDTIIASGSANSGSLLDLNQTWNTTGTPTAISLAIIDTASNANSKLINITVGGVNRFFVSKNGAGEFANLVSATGFNNSSSTTALSIRGGASTSAIYSIALSPLGTQTHTTGTGGSLNINNNNNYNPTSGTGIYNFANIEGGINQTGGASGITRGLYINPTLTAAADFRAIEVANGRVVISDTATVTGTNATSLLDLSQTWNTSGTPTALKLNITDTASNGNSRLLDIQVGGTSKLIFAKNGQLFFGTFNNSSTIAGNDTTKGLIFRTSLTTVVGSGYEFSNLQGNIANLSSTSNGLLIQAAGSVGFNPASGTGIYNSIHINELINQTGGANGITRGLYINPTLTSAADFRAIETTRGSVLIQNGTTPLLFVSQSGNVGIGTSFPSASLHISGASSANLLRIASPASSSILFVSGSGNVGINTTASTVALQIGDTTSGTGNYIKVLGNNSDSTYDVFVGARRYPRFTLEDTTVGGSAFQMWSLGNTMRFGTNTGTTETSAWYTKAGNAADVIFNGKLGIGTSTPLASLHISGASSANLLRIDSPTVNNILYISGSGTVGIGTSTPLFTLDIQSTATGSLRISGSGGSQITLVRPTAGLTGFMRYVGGTMDLGTSGADPLNIFTNNTARISIDTTGNVGMGIGTTPSGARLGIRGSGATSATTTFQVQNSTPTNLLTINDIGQVSFTSPTMSLAVSQSAFSISPIISASAVVGGQYYGVNITPTFFSTTGSQTETAFRVAATFTSSNATATGGTNIIADFGSTSAGSQLTVTDVTSGSIYMVNDVSGLPIIEATSDWGVKIYDFPRVVLEKTGSQVNINGTLQVSGSFILPLSQSATPQTGSAYWSGSLLFIYNGTRYMSASFF
jgi:hypothetical protein